MIDLAALAALAVRRAERWHKGTPEWSLLEWAGAMAGEAGESANAAKKVKRALDLIESHGGVHDDLPDASARVAAYSLHTAKEAADTLIYALHVIMQAGHDPEVIVRDVFNSKSDEYGFPEKI